MRQIAIFVQFLHLLNGFQNNVKTFMFEIITFQQNSAFAILIVTKFASVLGNV